MKDNEIMITENIQMTEAIYRGRAGKGVGESILELYNKYLHRQGILEKLTLKTNGIKITIERDFSEIK